MTTTPHDKQWELIAEKSPALVEARQQLVAALAACKLKDEALSDMRSGWRYIRETYGDLYGVGWERAENKADAALAIQPDDAALKAWLEIALRIKTEEHQCCSEDLTKLRESEQTGWKEAAIAWEVCGSIHEAFAKKKDALYSTRHLDFERHAEDARRKLSTESKEKVE